MPSEPKATGVDFGVIIAFVAPGFVALLAASYHMPTARAWMSAASQMEQSVGVFLFVLLGSLSLGLVVSGIRAMLVDNVLYSTGLLRTVAVPRYSIDWNQVNSEKLVVLVTIRDNYYRYYQFYSNTFVALIIWSIARAYAANPALTCGQWLLIVGTVIALMFSSRDSLNKYATAVKSLFDTSNSAH